MTWSSLYFVSRFLKRKLSPAFSVLGQGTCPRLGNQGPDQDEFGRSNLWPRVWTPGTELQLCAFCCSSLPSSPSLIHTPELERAHEPAWDPEREPAVCQTSSYLCFPPFLPSPFRFVPPLPVCGTQLSNFILSSCIDIRTFCRLDRPNTSL